VLSDDILKHVIALPEAEFHEHKILLRFLGISLRVLRLEVSVCISGVWFSVRFASFLPLQCTRLREFEEIKISRQSCRGKLLRLLFGFRPRIRPQYTAYCYKIECFT
jgi:hypothetical protein